MFLGLEKKGPGRQQKKRRKKRCISFFLNPKFYSGKFGPRKYEKHIIKLVWPYGHTITIPIGEYLHLVN